MNTIKKYLSISFALLLFVACTAEPPEASSPTIESPTEIPATQSPTVTEPESTPTEIPSAEAPEPTVEPVVEPTAEAVSEPDPIVEEPTSEPAVNDKINLNDMESEQLTAAIPDFSSRMVREFFEYQPYISIQQFRREMGKYVDDDQIAFYEQYVYVPINVNESDAASLLQIPGLDEATAEALINGRPYDSNDAFLALLGESSAEVDVELARTYLTP